MSLVGYKYDVTKLQVLIGLQEHDLIMADEKFSGKTVKKKYSRACWTKRLGQVSKYHLKIQKMQKQRIRKISSQWHFKVFASVFANDWTELTLETLALKKAANDHIFEAIKKEHDACL